jgi:predicted O-methyltransferase YrrM
MRCLVAEDLAAVRSQNGVAELSVISSRPPVTVLGRVGSPQEYLYYITRWLQPETIVETGVDRGLSSAFVLAAIHDNGRGHLYSIDLPTARYFDPITQTLAVSSVGSRIIPGFVIPMSLRGAWSLRLGDSRTVLPSLLDELGPIDLFFHDSEHTYDVMMEEYRQALRHLRPGGILASDDVNWNKAFHETVRHGPFDFSAIVNGRLGVARVRAEATTTQFS